MHMNTNGFSTAEAVDTIALTGLIAGTTLMTLGGEVPVENLSVGDKVVTRDCGMSIVREIRVATLQTKCIRIKAGSLGHSRPDRDMLVAANALIHIRDWRAQALFGTKTAMVPAHRLIDGEFVTALPERTVKIYEVIFDRPHILYADGIEVASGPM